MIAAHDALEELRAEWAAEFEETALAHELASMTRTVARQRTARAALGTALTVALLGAMVVTTSHLSGPSLGIVPAIAAPPAIASDIPAGPETITVSKDERVKDIAGDLADAFGVTRATAYQALVDALPPEALGSPEGWVAVGDYTFKNRRSLRTAATEMVGAQVVYLISIGLPHDDWHHAIVLASIAQQEAGAAADQSLMVRVMLNRLDAKMPLAVESVPLYAAQGLYAIRFTSMWPEAQYNMFERTGLPPTAIGAPAREAIDAAAHPATGEWLYFRKDAAGNVHPSNRNEKFAPGPDLFFPSETQDD